MSSLGRQSKKVLVAIVGATVLLVGIVAIPYPGPGWLIVFAGLAILGTEFAWAQQILHKARARYDQWVDWLKRQHVIIRWLMLAFTFIVVIVTIWLFNGYGLINGWLGLGWDWLRSPLPIFY